MVPFSGGGRSAHVATNMSNHMMRSITTKTCIINFSVQFISGGVGKEDFKLSPLVK